MIQNLWVCFIKLYKEIISVKIFIKPKIKRQKIKCKFSLWFDLIVNIFFKLTCNVSPDLEVTHNLLTFFLLNNVCIITVFLITQFIKFKLKLIFLHFYWNINTVKKVHINVKSQLFLWLLNPWTFKLNYFSCQLLVNYSTNWTVFYCDFLFYFRIYKVFYNLIFTLCCWLETKVNTDLLIIGVCFKNFLKISHNFNSVIIFVVIFKLMDFLLKQVFLFLLVIFTFTFIITLIFWWLRLDCISIEISTFFIIPSSKFIKEKFEVIVIEFKTNDFIVFNDFGVLIETRIWLRWHFYDFIKSFISFLR